MRAVRSHQFNPDLDPELLRSIEAAAGSFSPYKVELRSGYRPGDKRFHGQRKALDVQLYDPKTGGALDSYQGGGAVDAYQQFANHWYSQLSPEMQKRARWGGYFGDPTQSGYGSKYGDQDYMHFDLGGDRVGMLGGGWETGFRPEAMKILGLKGAGGVTGGGAAPDAAIADVSKQFSLPPGDPPSAPGSDLSYDPPPVPEQPAYKIEQPAPAQVAQREATPIVDPKRQQAQKQQLAQILAMLGGGMA